MPDSFDAWLAAGAWRPLIMGVLNVTPDSFSDGGRFEGPSGVDRAADEAVAMVAAGADLIDIGGESTRPGSLPVPEAEQIRRVVPVLDALRKRLGFHDLDSPSPTRPGRDHVSWRGLKPGAMGKRTRLPVEPPANRQQHGQASTLAHGTQTGIPTESSHTPHPVTPSPCHQTLPITISVDTTRAAVAEAALDAGAWVVNDVSAGRDDAGMLPLVARRGVPVILMHMQGTPATMQIEPKYEDVTQEVAAFLRERMQAARAAGVAESRILVNPGFGFGKTMAHNLELLRQLSDLAALSRPLVIGVSRKAFIGKVTGAPDVAGRLFGGAAAVAWSIAHGAAIIRTHDVAAMSQVARMIGAIQFDE